MKKLINIALLLVMISLCPVIGFAKITEQSMIFTPGTYQKIQTGTFKGYDDIRYKIYAKKGQILKFQVNSNQNLANINIFLPGQQPGKQQAIFIGATQGQTGEVMLAAQGEYTVQVYQMRNSARQNKTVNFQLYIEIRDQNAQLTENFDATGAVPYTVKPGQPIQ